jgi:hypothetical protein
MANYTLAEHLKNLEQSIEQAKITGLKLNVVLIASKCCSECDKINEQKIPFEEVLKNPAFPYKNCIRKPFCFCCYGFEPVRDGNGRLIRTSY